MNITKKSVKKNSKPIETLVKSDFWKNLWDVIEATSNFDIKNISICDYNAKTNKHINYLKKLGYNIETNKKGSNKQYQIVLSINQINEKMNEHEINNHIFELEQISCGAIIFITNSKVTKLKELKPEISEPNFKIYFS
jgi:hypothetical protein